MKVEYYSVDIKDGASKTSRSLRGVTLAAGQSFELPVENAAIFTETETVLLPSVIIPKGSYKGQHLVAYVSAINADSISLIPVNIPEGEAGIEIGTIEQGTNVTRMGRAARELDVQTSQYVALPRKTTISAKYSKVRSKKVSISDFPIKKSAGHSLIRKK